MHVWLRIMLRMFMYRNGTKKLPFCIFVIRVVIVSASILLYCYTDRVAIFYVDMHWEALPQVTWSVRHDSADLSSHLLLRAYLGRLQPRTRPVPAVHSGFAWYFEPQGALLRSARIPAPVPAYYVIALPLWLCAVLTGLLFASITEISMHWLRRRRSRAFEVLPTTTNDDHA